jgi:hypothetical protein
VVAALADAPGAAELALAEVVAVAEPPQALRATAPRAMPAAWRSKARRFTGRPGTAEGRSTMARPLSAKRPLRQRTGSRLVEGAGARSASGASNYPGPLIIYTKRTLSRQRSGAEIGG